VNIKDIKKSIYQKRAEDPAVWALAGFRNEEIGKFFLRKYRSYYWRLEQEHLELASGDLLKKKRRFNHRDGDLHRYVLMFFGYAIENYLKGILIKRGCSPIETDAKSKLRLVASISNHKLVDYFNNVFSTTPDKIVEEALKNLQRAIESGKYGVPKYEDQYYSFTANFDQTIIIAKGLIKKIKKILSPNPTTPNPPPLKPQKILILIAGLGVL